MRWHELTVYTTDAAVEMVSYWINELGAGGVEIQEPWDPDEERDTSLGQWYELPPSTIPEGHALIKGYFPEPARKDEIVAQLQAWMEGLRETGIDPGDPRYEWNEVDDEDWANNWKQYFKPVRVTERLTIKPTWEEYEATDGEIILELDPGMAFGTGTHATTSLCLKLLDQIIRPGDEVIDVGTGSGILSIAAAKLGANRVLALDLDPVAVASATSNVQLNGLEDRITVKHSDLMQVLKSDENLGIRLPVRVVVANILAEIIVKFVEDVHAALQPGGLYVVSGVIDSKAQMVKDALEQAGFQVEQQLAEQDWVALAARKR